MNRIGFDKLWNWFGLGRCSFRIMPRVMMHDMPDDWQSKMADLLNEWDETWKNQEDFEVRAEGYKNGKRIKWDERYLNYRHPNREFLDTLKGPQ